MCDINCKCLLSTCFLLLCRCLIRPVSVLSQRCRSLSLFFIDLYVLNVIPPQRAHRYLVSKGKSSSDLRQFKSQLNLIWFHLYHRQRNAGWEAPRQTPADHHVVKSVCVDRKRSRDLLQLCEGLFMICCWSRILFACGISKCSQPGLKWVRACICWWDQIWIRNRRFSQLDPVLPAGEKQPLGLQRLQGQGPWLSE